jgi:ATP-binding cassette subfamily B protein
MNLPKTPLRFILHFMAEQKFKFGFLFFGAGIWTLNDVIFPYFLKRIVNTLQTYQGTPADIYTALSGILILLVLFWLITESCMRLQGITEVYVYPKFRASIRRAVFDYVQSHSHSYFSDQFSGSIAKKLSDLPTSCQSIVEIVCFAFFIAALGSVGVFTMLWLINPIFALILLAWLCAHLSITFFFFRQAEKLWGKHSEAVSTLSGKIIDALTNMLNVRLFARRHYETAYLKRFQDDEMKKAHKARWRIEMMRFCLGISGLSLIFGMIFTLLKGWQAGWVTLGDFTQVGMQTFWILGWAWNVSFQVTIFARESGTVSDSLQLIRKGHDLVDKPAAKPIVITNGRIQFEQVLFEYKKNRPIFENLNLTIPTGQKVGLVGFSGSGKTTFVNLLLRFYDIQSGRINIDNQDIAKVTQDSLRSQIAMIPQDSSLFHRTLMDNIRYGRLDASDEEVLQASKLAHCHEFIMQLDQEYEALVGERGIKLSGGQRQRIAIARAVLKNAPILILDEATSSLDSVTEKLIQDSLKKLMQNRTTIVVAHRLSTLSDMDRVLVFHHGKIIEDGTKENLLQANGHFATLWAMQTDGFLPEQG